MPIKKSPSKKAFKENIKKEVKVLKKKEPAKKAVKQAVAIAYSVKKKAGKKK